MPGKNWLFNWTILTIILSFWFWEWAFQNAYREINFERFWPCLPVTILVKVSFASCASTLCKQGVSANCCCLLTGPSISVLTAVSVSGPVADSVDQAGHDSAWFLPQQQNSVSSKHTEQILYTQRVYISHICTRPSANMLYSIQKRILLKCMNMNIHSICLLQPPISQQSGSS